MTEKKEISKPEYLNIRDLSLQAINEMRRPMPAHRLRQWENFNDLTGGFRKREYSIFCGPTGVGKTQFLANLSSQLLSDRIPHFVMSVETGPTDYLKRIYSAFAGIDLNTGDMVGAEIITKVQFQNQDIFDSDLLQLSLYENRMPVERLKHDILHMKKNHGCDIVIVDNFNFFMEITSAANERIEMDRVCHEMIIFCKQVDVHIVMVMHPRKTEGGRVESEFDVKGSATAVQEAHNVFLFNRPDQKLLDAGFNKYDRQLKLAKMRRRGKNVGKSVMFGTSGGGVSYFEKAIVV